jgi:phosphatidylglycerol:prolipoprotein diacylglycerol transferase
VYPTISDLLKDLFGINIPLPIQSFGFFVAISFLLAAYTLSLEFKRKENQGLIHPVVKKTLQGEPAKISELFFSAVLGFIIGFKLVYFIFNYRMLVENPQQALLSGEGNFLGGLVFGAASAFLKYREKEKTKKEKPEWVDEKIHPYQLVGNITMIAAVAGLIGAKIFHNLENMNDFVKDPVDALLSFSGLTMYGGLIVGGAALIWYGIKNGIAPLHTCDANAPGLMLAYGFGRIGCQVAGDGDWGIVNTAPKPNWMGFLPDWFWSFRYPHNVVNEGIPIPGCVGRHCNMLELPVFPTPLYESIVCIGLFIVLWGLRKRFTTPGMMFFVYILLNGIERFFIELIRVNTKYHLGGIDFTQAQLISLCLIILGVGGIIYCRKKNKTIPTPEVISHNS